jgi:hypothetical protein
LIVIVIAPLAATSFLEVIINNSGEVDSGDRASGHADKLIINLVNKK